MKLNLGSGDSQYEGFTSVDLYDSEADIQADICQLPVDNNSVEEIVAFQVIEHVPYWQESAMFAEMYRVLIPGGRAIVECPDLEYISREIVKDGDINDKWLKSIYGEYYRPWDVVRYPDATDHEGSKHRNGFTYGKIERLCLPLGFDIRRREMGEKHPDYQYEENLSVILTKRNKHEQLASTVEGS